MRTPLSTHVVAAANEHVIHALDPASETRTRCGVHIDRGFYCASLSEAGRRFPHAALCEACAR